LLVVDGLGPKKISSRNTKRKNSSQCSIYLVRASLYDDDLEKKEILSQWFF
jgi:hypothetical protein